MASPRLWIGRAVFVLTVCFLRAVESNLPNLLFYKMLYLTCSVISGLRLFTLSDLEWTRRSHVGIRATCACHQDVANAVTILSCPAAVKSNNDASIRIKRDRVWNAIDRSSVFLLCVSLTWSQGSSCRIATCQCLSVDAGVRLST